MKIPPQVKNVLKMGKQTDIECTQSNNLSQYAYAVVYFPCDLMPLDDELNKLKIFKKKHNK